MLSQHYIFLRRPLARIRISFFKFRIILQQQAMPPACTVSCRLESPRKLLTTEPPPSFPPGSQPPDDPWFYDVPHSAPRLNIKFRDFTHDPYRSEISVYTVFRKAFVRASGPERRDEPLLQPESATRGRVSLVVEPQGQHHLLPFTYGRWLTALRGLYSFVRAYPLLDFSFEIYGYEERMPDTEFYLAYGWLQNEH